MSYLIDASLYIERDPSVNLVIHHGSVNVAATMLAATQVINTLNMTSISEAKHELVAVTTEAIEVLDEVEERNDMVSDAIESPLVFDAFIAAAKQLEPLQFDAEAGETVSRLFEKALKFRSRVLGMAV